MRAKASQLDDGRPVWMKIIAAMGRKPPHSQGGSGGQIRRAAPLPCSTRQSQNYKGNQRGGCRLSRRL